jgi:O-antigen/teichoic acid export membrane protein
MSETSATPPTIDHKQHAAFFRQSGWMMLSSIIAGFMSLGVHFLNKLIPQGEYSNFGVLVMVIACLPTMPLQMVFAQQTAAALAENRERRLIAMIRWTWFWTFAIWIVVAVLAMIFQKQIADGWQLSSTAPLYATIFAILVSMWLPLFAGVMQGRQDFFWYGWANIAGGVLRLAAGAAAVIVFHLGASGMLWGATIGVGVASLIVIGRTRDLWSWGQPSEPFDSKALFKQIMPLIFAFGVCQFLFTTDTMYAQVHFSADSMKRYVAAGTLSRALLWLVLPISAVMFPKIVHASAKKEKSNLLAIVIAGTAVLAVVGAAGLCIVGPIVVRIVFKPEDVADTVALLPWYAGAMIPLALANVLVNDLMARGRFKVVPFMVAIGVAYAFTLPYILRHYPDRMTVVLQTLFVFTTLLFIVCAWFTWGQKSPVPAVPSPQS